MRNQIDILLVEDSASDVRLTEEALKESGLDYKLSVLTDGEEAMTFLKRLKQTSAGSRPDVILLDLNMPKKNGHEVLSEIKDDPDLAAIPVVLLTVSQRDHDVLEALRLKMNYYLPKPIDSEKLAHLLPAIFELNDEAVSDSRTQPIAREELHVRLVLANNPHTAPIVLRKLATEADVRIRCRVAENPKTPQDILAQLARDESAEVRLSIAENPQTPKTVLELLSKDASDDVRLGLAENPNLPSEILQTLASDDNVFVASCAAKTLSNTGVSLV